MLIQAYPPVCQIIRNRITDDRYLYMLKSYHGDKCQSCWIKQLCQMLQIHQRVKGQIRPWHRDSDTTGHPLFQEESRPGTEILWLHSITPLARGDHCKEGFVRVYKQGRLSAQSYKKPNNGDKVGEFKAPEATVRPIKFYWNVTLMYSVDKVLKTVDTPPKDHPAF
jgi:hypothetical protein